MTTEEIEQLRVDRDIWKDVAVRTNQRADTLESLGQDPIATVLCKRPTERRSVTRDALLEVGWRLA